MSQPFRILSLDGGGIMGAFAASALATFERETGQRIIDHFDLITGTSTGGIIAIGLAMETPAEEIARFYETEGPKIFPKRSGINKWLGRVRGVFQPRFSSSALSVAIQEVAGDRPLKEAKTRLVIPSYDVNTGKVYVFKTPHHPWYSHHADLSAVDVALATSAAPTYFPAHTIPGRGTFIDGGLWANCPAMVGVVEARRFPGPSARARSDAEPEHDQLPVPAREARATPRAGGLGAEDHRHVHVRPMQAAVNMASCLLSAVSSTGSTTRCRLGPSRWTTPPAPGNSRPWAGRSPS